jgi:haloalkane dehalogenase
MDAIRTPDEVLEGLPDFPFAPHYREVEGLRLAHIDEGDGPPVVMFHGEPTWSFLWRKVLPPVVDAGYRVILPDAVGFGRSDKPTERDWYTYERHVEYAATLLEDLDIRGATFVVHDWGGPIGLRLAVDHPDRVDRLVLMDTGISTGDRPMGEEWQRFRAFVDRIEDVPMSPILQGGTETELSPEVLAGYEKPFPNAAAKAGMRAFPGLIPQTPDAPGAADGRRVIAALREDPRPKLVLWADGDFVLPPATGEAFAAALGVDPPTPIAGAGHFLQEDKGAEIGAIIADWLADR